MRTFQPCGCQKKLNQLIGRSLSTLCFVFVLWPSFALPQGGYSFAIAARGTIDMKGNNLATDSFDSSATNYPGYWTNSIRRANGDVATDGTILVVANADVAGHVMTGPGGSVSIAVNGSVGDLAWVDSGTPGIQPGYLSEDINVNFKDVVIPGPPQAIWNGAPGAGTAPVYAYAGTTITATNTHSFGHVITTSGNYTINDNGDIYVGSNCVVNLKVLSSVGTFNPNMLYSAGRGTNAAKVTCYIDCTNAFIGTDDRPQSGIAGNMIFLGTSNCTSFLYKGNGDFCGVIYAPSANFQLAGGGSGILDFLGSVVAKSIQMNGHYHFHADESLFRSSSPIPFLFASPDENRSVLVGQNTTLSTSVLGWAPFAYQWSFADSILPDATNSSLSLTNIQLTDAGLYLVTITNVAGSVTSSVNLQVYSSPTPMMQTPTLSSNGQMQVSIAGVPGFHYAIESSTNLVDWIPLTTNVSPYSFIETNTGFFPQNYYRAVYVP
jgi:hypothetical protein